MANKKRNVSGKWFIGMLGTMVSVLALIVLANYSGQLSLNNGVRAASDRPRVKLGSNGYILTGDTNWPLRGDNPRWQTGNTSSLWPTLKSFNMNVARVLVYREHSITYGWDSPQANMFSASDADVNDDLQLDASELAVYKSKIMDEMVSRLDKWVNDASANGMYLIIDYHPVGGYEEIDAREWWKIIAPRYKDRTHVIYELSNEPVSWSATEYSMCNDNQLTDPSSCPRDNYAYRIRDYKYKTPIDWQVAMYKQIRAAAPNTHIILWSFANGTGDMVGVANKGKNLGINYTNASVSYHMYGKNDSAITNLKNSYNVIVSEMGDKTTDGYNSKVATAERLGTKSWILLDGIGSGKQVTVTWPCDPYLCSSSQVTPTPVPTSKPTSTPMPGPTNAPTSTPRPISTPLPGPSSTPTASPKPTLIPTPAVNRINLLPNSSFESDPRSNSDYFTVAEDKKVGSVIFDWANIGYVGSRSVGISTNSVVSTSLSRWLSQHNTSRQIAAEPGKTYKGEAWIKTEAVGNNSNITIVFWGPGVYDLAGVKTSSGVLGTSNWTYRSVEMVAPANTKYVRFEMRQVGNGKSWFDNASLVQL